MPYDVFLSYKTENANAVREVADCLIASGLAVWFAEYEITGDIYDDDVAVQAAIDAGVERSRHAVVFTNNRWARSTYCAREMTRIQQRIPASRTIEICIPSEDLPRTTWPVLRGVPFIEYSGRLEDVVAFINAQRWFTGALHVSRPPFSAGRATRQRMRFGITMDIGPLRDASSMQTLLSERERRFPGELYHFAGDVGAHRVRLLVNMNPHRTALGDLEVSEDGDADDWETHRKYRHFAARFLDEQARECRGIHLVFRHRRSNLGLTSVTRRRFHGKRDWERRYALVLRNPGGEDAGEVDVSFNVMLPADDEASRQEFCRLAQVFDRAVYDLAYARNTSLLSAEALRVVAAKLVLAALAAAAHDYVGTQYSSQGANAVTAALLGLFAADLAFAVASHRSRRRADLLGMTVGPRIRTMPTYGRLLDQLWDIGVGTLLSAARLAMFGVLNPLSVIAVIAAARTGSPPFVWTLIGAGLYACGEIVDRSISGRQWAWK